MLDNYDLWAKHDAEQEAALERLPRCCECDEPIQDDYCYEVNGECVCEGCMTQNHRKWTEDFMQ